MPEPTTWALFAVAALALLVTPGPAVLYIVARSIDQGRLAGFVSTLGIQVGTMFHVVAAALGVSAILVSSALAFNVVKWLGALYLIYLGIAKLLERRQPAQAEVVSRKPLKRIFYQGVLVNVLNPKTALFFFAFLPQFVDPARGAAGWQALALGLTFVCLGIISDGVYAMLAGTVGRLLRSKTRLAQRHNLFAGGVYITLGVATALSGTGERK